MNRYNFVPRIEAVAKGELVKLRKSPKGSHIDVILNESMLDYDYDKRKLNQILAKYNSLWMINSFMDVNPQLITHCQGSLLRGEFLFLRYLGDKVFDYTKKDAYIEFLEKTVFDSLPNNVIYRLSDYNGDDFNFLKNDYQSRGAARLLEQQDLLATDLDVISALQRKGKNVDVLVPYVVFPEEFTTLKQKISEKLRNIRTGIMLEVPANLLEVEKYSEADFYVFGPGDLIKNLYGGIDRNSSNFNKVNSNLIFPLINSALNVLDKSEQSKRVYLVKNLIGHNFGEHTNIDLIDMYMPAQLMAEARK